MNPGGIHGLKPNFGDGGYIRCPDWRPLTVEECRDRGGTPENGLAYFEAVGTDEPVYYWRRRTHREGDS
jgi:hypothetical protein